MSRSWTKHICAKNGYCPRHFWEGMNLKIEESYRQGPDILWRVTHQGCQLAGPVLWRCRRPFAEREEAVNCIAPCPISWEVCRCISVGELKQRLWLNRDRIWQIFTSWRVLLHSLEIWDCNEFRKRLRGSHNLWRLGCRRRNLQWWELLFVWMNKTRIAYGRHELLI